MIADLLFAVHPLQLFSSSAIIVKRKGIMVFIFIDILLMT